MTKRKAAQALVPAVAMRKRKPRKPTQPFTAPKYAKTKQIIQRNSTESPLLRLPLEIRERVWAHVFNDGRLLHIKQLDDRDEPPSGDDWMERGVQYYGWHNVYCLSQHSSRDTYENSKTKSVFAYGSTLEDREAHNPHRDCKQYLNRESNLEIFNRRCQKDNEPEPQQETVQLQLFRTCRQIYFEANHAFWSNTTFGFTEPDNFAHFMANRTPHQKRDLQKLHLEFELLTEGSFNDWHRALAMKVVKTLTGLRTFHLHVRHGDGCWGEDYGMVAEDLRDLAFESLLNFRTLPLKKVTVVFQNHFLVDDYDTRWSHARHREWAEYFREALLDPNGLQVWQARQDELRRSREESKANELAYKRSTNCFVSRAECHKRLLQDAEMKGKKFKECEHGHRCEECGFANYGPECWKCNPSSMPPDSGYRQRSMSS
ncbi:hypothetical protein BT63DRAFT_483959 [Microthyrium microscopicum]|uniref:DUF7730 domain-containing protein n=1 Tax=Microthyrium microscopicum TaxID=703497 RepID=A0A6A6TWD8_9PEZI|nr:hypothetical protein BT63DRAFT_483959 [Microthyrium microscopicum]